MFGEEVNDQDDLVDHDRMENVTTTFQRHDLFLEVPQQEEKHDVGCSPGLPSFRQRVDADCTTLAPPLMILSSKETDPTTKNIQQMPHSSTMLATKRVSSLHQVELSSRSSSSPAAAAARGVSFAMVEIREHPIIVGDHPGVKKGVPLSIGWESVDRIALDVDRYEAARIHHRRPARSMRLVAEHREQLLRTLGFTREEMLWGQANAKLVRKLREKTNDRLSLDRFHEVWESIGRKFRNLVTFGKFKRRQKEYLQRHVRSCNDLEALDPSSACPKVDAMTIMTKRSSFVGGSTVSTTTWLGDSNRRGSSSSILSVRSLQESLGYLSEDDYF